jgi:hypothetical protein
MASRRHGWLFDKTVPSSFGVVPTGAVGAAADYSKPISIVNWHSLRNLQPIRKSRAEQGHAALAQDAIVSCRVFMLSFRTLTTRRCRVLGGENCQRLVVIHLGSLWFTCLTCAIPAPAPTRVCSKSVSEYLQSRGLETSLHLSHPHVEKKPEFLEHPCRAERIWTASQ